MIICYNDVRTRDVFGLFGISDGTMQESLFALKYEKQIKIYLETFDVEWKKYYPPLREKYGSFLDSLLPK
jgi:hypothetical protein